jgi:prepilin-type N-terminal cleavage/methylation domain-containing protein
VLQSRAGETDSGRAGFTLIEALVALALILAFVEVLNPYLFHLRRIGVDADRRVAAQVLLRSLLDAPFDRSQLAQASRSGQLTGLRWQIVTEPLVIATLPPDGEWKAFRVTARVLSDRGQVAIAETVRLAKSEPRQ